MTVHLLISSENAALLWVMLLFVVSLFTLIVSCKNEKKETNLEDSTQKEVKKEPMLMVQPKDVKITWTAYKTTEKKPVSGTFKKVDFAMKHGKTPLELINGLSFTIPVSSVFSNNDERDKKLIASFFGAMTNTELISGKLQVLENKSVKASITLNGEAHDLPLIYKIENDTIYLQGVMNMEDWKATGAIAALNKVCFDLHKGADGVSKTWNEVLVKVEVHIDKM